MWLLLGGTIEANPFMTSSLSQPTLDEVKLSFTSFLEFHMALCEVPQQNNLLPAIFTQHCGVSQLLPDASQLEERVARKRAGLQQANRSSTSPTAEIQAEFRDTVLHPTELFLRLSASTTTGRKLIRTEKGVLGLGPKSARVGDEVWFLQGGKIPFLLRRMSNGNSELVGEAYVHGHMQGEIFSKAGFRVENAALVTIQ